MPNVRAMRLRMRGVPMMRDMPGILAALLDGARSPRLNVQALRRGAAGGRPPWRVW